MFCVNILSRPVSNVIPNILNLFTPQFDFHFVVIDSVLYLLEPTCIHTTCVLKKLNLRAYFSSSYNVSFRDSSKSSNVTVESLVYCVIIKSFLLISIHFIFFILSYFYCSNFCAECAGDWVPLLQQRSVLKHEERLPS